MTRRTDAIGAGVVLWLFTLPHVVLLAVFAIDDDAIVPVALLALVTWIVACVWATD